MRLTMYGTRGTTFFTPSGGLRFVRDQPTRARIMRGMSNRLTAYGTRGAAIFTARGGLRSGT